MRFYAGGEMGVTANVWLCHDWAKHEFNMEKHGNTCLIWWKKKDHSGSDLVVFCFHQIKQELSGFVHFPCVFLIHDFYVIFYFFCMLSINVILLYLYTSVCVTSKVPPSRGFCHIFPYYFGMWWLSNGYIFVNIEF